MAVTRFLRYSILESVYLIKTYAPIDIFFAHFTAHFRNRVIERIYGNARHAYKEQKSLLKLSNDWFTNNIPFWLSVFDEYRLRDKENITALEIGSWEGLSSHFILRSLSNVTLTCVDTWDGADEHKSGDFATNDVLNNIESSFDHNLSAFGNRLIKYKGTSFSFFQSHPVRNAFDLIYVDGSHYVDDVLIDAIKCFEMLKIGGVMIFDDYFWKYYPLAIDNPAFAINTFLRLKKGSYRIVRMYYQIIIEKTKDRY